MSVVENIVGALVILIVFLLVGILVFNSMTKTSMQDLMLEEGDFLKNKWETDLNALLIVTEPQTNQPIGFLLSDAIFFRDEIITVNSSIVNATINVTQLFKDLLDRAYGPGEYYINFRPIIVDVSLNFIVDGTNSLVAERQFLATNMTSILDTILHTINKTGEEKVMATVYVIGSRKCDIFDNLGDSRVICRVLDENDLYVPEPFYNTTLNQEKLRWNIRPPYNYSWLNGNQYAKAFDYYGADWGTGTAFASMTSAIESLSRLTLFFPFGDELSSSSISDSCYNYSDQEDWILCGLCDDNCPTARSRLLLNRTINVLKNHNHYAFPIYSFNCDYAYAPIWGQFRTTHANYGAAPPPNDNWCTNTECGGCSVTGGGTCFHSNCWPQVKSQMQWLANETGGTAIELTNLNALSSLILNATNQTFNVFNVTIGNKNASRERYVLNRIIPMAKGYKADVNLWVYKK